ncbi:SDR family oxidoreductase [Thalassospira xiamenensis]|uniref:SDR family oxidoreductase n=1 Tax=Thalassospira xiamenensis TaxID=220697 RepID=UPI003AA94B8F
MKTIEMVQTNSVEAAGPILVTGAGGTLGYYFCSAWGNGGAAGRRVVPVIRDRTAWEGALGQGANLAPVEVLDLSDGALTDGMIARLKPSVVIHCAALADVDQCEEDRHIAFRDNVEATRSIVSALQRHVPGCHLVHISTDQVYCDGGGYRGDLGPVNLYGWTKLWSEDIAHQHKITTVFRLNYVGRGVRGRSGLINWLVESLSAEKPITLFQDVLFNPCHGALVPQVAAHMIATRTLGTFNLGAHGGGLSKADFLLAVAKEFCLPIQTVQFGRLSDLSLKAPRALDIRMDVSATETALGEKLPCLSKTLEALVDEWQQREKHDA